MRGKGRERTAKARGGKIGAHGALRRGGVRCGITGGTVRRCEDSAVGTYSTQRPTKAQERRSPGLTAAVAETTRKKCVTCGEPLGWDVAYVLHGEKADQHEHAHCYYLRCDKALTRSWVAAIAAEPGKLLLGGVRVHRSSRFAQWQQADHWATVVEKTNADAGRKVDSSGIDPVNIAPEVY